MADTAEYDLDLLTSFDARSSHGGLLTTDEGLRKFQQVMARGEGSVSTVQVKMRVEPASVVITDASTGEEMEYIPVGLVYQPVAVDDRSLNPYNNLLVFTVLEDSFQMAPPEMYFFQCLSCPVSSVADASEWIEFLQ